MTATQLEKALHNYTKGLPKEALQEVLDFIQSLRQRSAKKSASEKPKKKYPTLSDSQTLHVKEEFADYKRLYPSE